MAEVMKPRIRHDTGLAARLAPEVVEFDAGQRPVSFGCRKHPLPRCHFGEAVQQLLRGLAEQNVPRSGLAVNSG